MIIGKTMACSSSYLCKNICGVKIRKHRSCNYNAETYVENVLFKSIINKISHTGIRTVTEKRLTCSTFNFFFVFYMDLILSASFRKVDGRIL